ncbi:RHS repeat domain-containing protein, partial [Elizabethkingia anophelis]|uniref:RHS repeat domain-containing protein n=1 Tax=Elizabethkingia anophelis TaxID=1117645 RepID=UPI0021AA0811
YNYTDHLGNVRLSYTKGASGGAEIIEENNYYPFGLKHQGYNSSSLANSAYQYKYNGKELQETGMYDYGARMYMPELGRWGVVDPLAEINRAWSPYRYAYNNPLVYTDPDGRNEDWYKDEDGSYVYDAQLTADNASKRLNTKQTYLGESANVILKNDETVVGVMNLGSDGNISFNNNTSLSESWDVTYTSISTPLGNVMVADPKLPGNAKVFGVDTSQNTDSKFEDNARFVAESSPSTLSKYLSNKIEGIEKKYEIIQNSFDEGTGDDPGVSTTGGSIANSALRNMEKQKYETPKRKFDTMQNDSVLKRRLIYPNNTSQQFIIPIPKNKK